MTKNHTCRTQIIRDIPSDKDLFPSQAHEKIAEAISEIIKNGIGGITIGIEGKFGSGKSTIITLIKNILHDDPDTKESVRFAIFDVWAHEGNLLRYIFLKKVIDILDDKDKGSWFTDNELKNNVTNHIENGKITKFIPQNRKFIALTSIYLLLLPTLVNLLFEGITIGVTFPIPFKHLPINFHFLIGLFGIIIPAVLILSYVQKKNEKGEKIIEFLISRNIKNDDHELSSVEYDEWFIKILTNTLTDDRKLVLVIDNLDRLAPEKRLSFLSTLQTFLQYSQKYNKYSDLISDHLWVIIPYSEKVIKNDKTDKGPITDETEIFNKRVQITYKAPMLLLSNWEKFLKEKLEEAFRDHEDIEEVVLVIKEKINDRPPQPRKLISIINSIGVLHSQWCPDIPLAHLAYFVMTEPDSSVVSPESYFQSLLDKPNNSLRDSMICLLYNAEIDKARELYLREPLKSALENGNIDSYKQLLLDNESSVGTYIDSIFHEFGEAKNNLDRIYNLIYTVEESGSLNRTLKQRKKNLIRYTKGMIKSSVSDKKLTRKNSMKASYLIKFFSEDKEIINRIIMIVNPPFSQEETEVGQDNLDIEIDSAVDGFVTLSKTLNEYNNTPPLLQIRIKTTEERFFEFLQGVYEKSELSLVKRIRFFARQEPEGTSDFSNVVTLPEYSGPPFKSSILGAFKILDKLKTVQYDKVALNNRIREILVTELISTSFDPYVLTSTNTLLDSLFYFVSEIEDNLDKLINLLSGHTNGLLIRAFEKNFKQNNYFEAARWFYLHLFCFPKSLSFPTSPFANDYDAHFLETFATQENIDLKSFFKQLESFIITDNMNIKEWFENISVNDKSVHLLFQILISFKSLGDDFKLDQEWVYNHWLIFKQSLGDNYKQFILLLSQGFSIEEIIMKEGFDFQHSVFYADLINYGDNKDFREYCKKEKLQNISIQQWEEYFTNKHDIFKLVVTLLPKVDTLALNHPFMWPFIEFVKSYAHGNIIIDKTENHWKDLYKALHKGRLITTREEIFQEIEGLKETTNANFFEIFGPILIDEKFLQSQDRKVVRLFIPLIKGGNPEQIQWVVNLLELLGEKVISKDPNDTIIDFRDAINTQIENESLSEPVKNLLLKLINLPALNDPKYLQNN